MSHRFQQDTIETLRCADGVDRALHCWLAEAPVGVMIGVHGGLAHAGDFVTPALHFKSRGWHTVSLDQRGHGVQKRVHIDRFDDFIADLDILVQQVKGRWPELPVYLLAHSMGGLIAAHFGLRLSGSMDATGSLTSKASDIQGYILSSPYWANAIAVNPLIRKLSGVLSRLTPTLKAPLEDFTDVLTHDTSITQRHRDDARDAIRASEVTIRFGAELLAAQAALAAHIDRWDQPLYVMLAGQDKLADNQQLKRTLESISSDDVTLVEYADNYHENLNELNREKVYSGIERWLAERLTRAG
jgi:alpha-beta hydrolase superfamily lysophospholipase